VVRHSERVPDRGDLAWINFDPQAGHEQSGRHPAIVLSPAFYNRPSGLALFCPITSRVKGYPFEVRIPPGLSVSGVILSDQVKSLDWRARDFQSIDRLPPETMMEILGRIQRLLTGVYRHDQG
jgi:mRNA interferase MazF